MITAAIEKRTGPGINWLKVQRYFCLGCLLSFVYAAGGWTVSMRVKEASLPYLQKSTNQLETIHRAVGQNPVAAVNCARNQAGKAMDAAGQAVASKYIDAVPEPNLANLPTCPPLPPPKTVASVR